MNHPTFAELLQRLREGDERVEIEAKAGRKIDRAVMETVCAFSNEPARGGGYLLLGVKRDESMLFPDYVVLGVKDTDRIQRDLATQC